MSDQQTQQPAQPTPPGPIEIIQSQLKEIILPLYLRQQLPWTTDHDTTLKTLATQVVGMTGQNALTADVSAELPKEQLDLLSNTAIGLAALVEQFNSVQDRLANVEDRLAKLEEGTPDPVGNEPGD